MIFQKIKIKIKIKNNENITINNCKNNQAFFALIKKFKGKTSVLSRIFKCKDDKNHVLNTINVFEVHCRRENVRESNRDLYLGKHISIK